MYGERSWTRERVASAAGVALVHALIGWALVTGLRFELPVRVSDELKLIDILPAPEPPKPAPPPPREVRSERPEGEASPPNLRAEPTQIVLPPPKVQLPVETPVPAAPIAGRGSAPSAGSAEVPGPGYGAGGVGDGRGSGGFGDGDGAGGWTPPRLRRGRIRNSDYPREAGEAGEGGTVGVRFVVEPDGRVSRCSVTRSSGSRVLDDTTCRLIVERFRYTPSFDPAGRPVRATIVQNHSWVVRDEPADEGI